jgi:hypothetical protein
MGRDAPIRASARCGEYLKLLNPKYDGRSYLGGATGELPEAVVAGALL